MSETSEILGKLDTLIRLVAVGMCGDKPQKEKIAILDAAGLQPKLIAEILDTTPNNVSVVLYGLRKDRKRGQKIQDVS